MVMRRVGTTILGLLMLVVTVLAIRVRLRLLAVPMAALAGLWTAGAAGWLGLPLTPATLAVLPVVLGLTTDYVIQAVNRLAEEPPGTPGRLQRTARAILPATVWACCRGPRRACEAWGARGPF